MHPPTSYKRDPNNLLKRDQVSQKKRKLFVDLIDTNCFYIDGISRELYSLIGGAPPVAFVKPTFKSKFKTKKKATPWYDYINSS